MILYKKIKGNLNEINQALYYKIRNNQKVALNIIGKYIDLESVNYTYEDYEKDYPEKVSNYSESKVLYNIEKTGRALTSFPAAVVAAVRIGINYNYLILKDKDLREEFLEYLDISLDYKLDFESFEIHTEAYGEYEELERFKSDYEIKNEIIFEKYKEKWHLAFSGIISEYVNKKTSSKG